MFHLHNKRRENDMGVSPEEVLLQVTLAFTVVLGFLLSDENTFNASLNQRLTQAEQVYSQLQNESKITLVEQADAAVEYAEQLKLLNAWLEIRANHPIFLRVQSLEDSNGPLKTLSSKQLISHSMFLQLRNNITFLFRDAQYSDEPADNLAEEIATLTEKCVAKADYKIPEYPDDIPEWLNNTKTFKAMNFLERHSKNQTGIAQWKNIQFLIDEIHDDFFALRRRIARFQLRMVMEIAEEKAMQVSNTGISSDANQSLTIILDELDQSLTLLPEVRKQLLP